MAVLIKLNRIDDNFICIQISWAHVSCDIEDLVGTLLMKRLQILRLESVFYAGQSRPSVPVKNR